MQPMANVEQMRINVLRFFVGLKKMKGKQWTDSHIAKMCHVSPQTVTNAANELSKLESYQRPTKRRYLKNGNFEWMETAKINEPDEPDEDQAELDLEIPSKEVLEYLKEFQFLVRSVLTHFSDTHAFVFL